MKGPYLGVVKLYEDGDVKGMMSCFQLFVNQLTLQDILPLPHSCFLENKN